MLSGLSVGGIGGEPPELIFLEVAANTRSRIGEQVAAVDSYCRTIRLGLLYSNSPGGIRPFGSSPEGVEVFLTLVSNS